MQRTFFCFSLENSKKLSPHSLFSTNYTGRMCYNGNIQGSRILAP
nr:MAG TPA: hypothetical protein [Caudoviricetes sp.]